jgi:hypothetical protein
MHILGWLILAIASGLLVTALYIRIRASRQIGWCMGRCRIVQSEVVNLYEIYKPIIRFEYSFGGDTLLGKKNPFWSASIQLARSRGTAVFPISDWIGTQTLHK